MVVTAAVEGVVVVVAAVGLLPPPHPASTAAQTATTRTRPIRRPLPATATCLTSLHRVPGHYCAAWFDNGMPHSISTYLAIGIPLPRAHSKYRKSAILTIFGP